MAGWPEAFLPPDSISSDNTSNPIVYFAVKSQAGQLDTSA
jgi:hypothetical protein